ncbi:PDZ domain-containing protein [Virgibacillus sp. MSP4-1]|uniref:SepM family pheromone-processing serine protease n=1 Tax=Virgibacillus sp. MSP4-1 TaxID=2700081 RepID=UPI0003A73E34|nr:SepM family pheromone-processing serine protease [Virgibacillus sp. MSP4-1]QHS22148.1 PDZ domain-containing protein [Virgibacillus sp. MSP4-1]
MKNRSTQLAVMAIVLIIVIFLTTYQLPSYVYQPGNASELDPMVTVEEGYKSGGDMHLVTVRGGQATPVYYLWSMMQPYHDIHPLDEIRPEGISQEEYNHIQMEYMDSSQNQAIALAFQKAGLEVSYENEGVYVSYVEDDMPAGKVFKAGDKIISIDGKKVEHSEESVEYVTNKEEGERVDIVLQRNGEKMKEQVELAPFPDQPDKVGMGVGLVTKRSIITDPEVKINSRKIGGPSAGLMFTLEIFDQLTEKDYTKGKQVCGTGTINRDGKVGSIGGIDQKVVASDNDGCDIFFAPNEGGKKNSNYEVAARTAKEIESSMKVVPVDTFEDAVNYLENVE